MSSDELVTSAEQREAVTLVARHLETHGLKVLALGSVAVLLRTGVSGALSKDADVHAFPVGEFTDYLDALEEVASALGGHVKLEPDGASVTMHVPVRGRDVPVEIISGRDEFITPEVLADAAEGAVVRDGIYVPSWEHLVAMKAEAWYDRIGDEKRKYLQDLATMAEHLSEEEDVLARREVRRLVRMRDARKHDEMLRTIERVFAGRLR